MARTCSVAATIGAPAAPATPGGLDMSSKAGRDDDAGGARGAGAADAAAQADAEEVATGKSVATAVAEAAAVMARAAESIFAESAWPVIANASASGESVGRT